MYLRGKITLSNYPLLYTFLLPNLTFKIPRFFTRNPFRFSQEYYYFSRSLPLASNLIIISLLIFASLFKKIATKSHRRNWTGGIVRLGRRISYLIKSHCDRCRNFLTFACIFVPRLKVLYIIIALPAQFIQGQG